MNKRKKLSAAAILLTLILTITGCRSAAATDISQNDQTSGTSKSEMFTERDLAGDYDESSAEKIELSGESVTLTEEGTYIISGTLEDGQIIVDADDTAKIQIVLAGASITSKSSAALYVKSADKVFVTTAEGTENTLANGGAFSASASSSKTESTQASESDSDDAEDTTNIDGAVFAHDDIVFNGSGTLVVKSTAGHGIVGKDDIKLAGGTITIEAAEKGVQAQDSVRVAEATISITAGDDGIHVSDNSDEEEGTESDSFFYIADGNVTIVSGDDGIHADASATIEGGSIKITESYEGLEAQIIDISGGDIDIVASDDGINATRAADSSNQNPFEGDSGCSIKISGGNVKIQASGDGIDSNGSVEIAGGVTTVEGPTKGDTSVIDYDLTGTITGGTFIGTGGAGMDENFSSVESQGLIVVSVGNQSAGTTVKLTDSSENVIAEVAPELDYAVVYISTPEMASGNTYTLTAGSYSESIELTENSYSTLSGGMVGFGDKSGKAGFGGEPQGGPSDKNGENPDFGRGEKPQEPDGN